MRAGLRNVDALSSCTDLAEVDLSYATRLSDAEPLASCNKLETVKLQGCRGLPADSVIKLRRAKPGATILG